MSTRVKSVYFRPFLHFFTLPTSAWFSRLNIRFGLTLKDVGNILPLMHVEYFERSTVLSFPFAKMFLDIESNILLNNKID